MIRSLFLISCFVFVSAWPLSYAVGASGDPETSQVPSAPTPVTPTESSIPKFLQFLFPSLRTEEYDPSKTLQAPFAETDAAVGEEVHLKQPEDSIPLDKPHRPSADVANWAMEAVAEVMMFEGENYQQDLEDTKKYFDDGGRQQYESFLANTKMMKVLESRRYEIRAYVADAPLLLNEGPVSGRYRWLFEVPVMISYVPRGASTYKDLEPVNQSLSLRIQIGRTADANTKLRLQMERWSGKAKKLDKQ